MKFIAYILMLLLTVSCSGKSKTDFSTSNFVSIKNGHFTIGDSAYYFIGTNYWYGAILGSTGQGGNRDRLLKELDFMKSIGINNLRVLVGSDGSNDQPKKIRPNLQIKPGIYNDTIFDGLDFLLAELGKREMYAVLYLNNSWEWSGGYGQYLEWAGMGAAPREGVSDWPAFSKHVAQYAQCDSCHKMFLRHIEQVLSRTNKHTEKPYIDDPVIMAWQVGNEPRAFSNEGKDAFVKWLKDATALMRSLDANHLISIGNEGFMGCEGDWNLVEEINSDPNVDYMTIHIWPKNWSWIDIKKIPESVEDATVKTNIYINRHLDIAKKLEKPLVIEEFGFPRDNHRYKPDDTVIARDRYYANIFSGIIKSAKEKGNLSGCNFWAWGGQGRAKHEFWTDGDDYLGDPAQEEQGLNSVFDLDPTIGVIKSFTKQLK